MTGVTEMTALVFTLLLIGNVVYMCIPSSKVDVSVTRVYPAENENT